MLSEHEAREALRDYLSCGSTEIRSEQACELWCCDLARQWVRVGSGDSWAAAYADAVRRLERNSEPDYDAQALVGREAALHTAWLAKQPGRSS